MLRLASYKTDHSAGMKAGKEAGNKCLRRRRKKQSKKFAAEGKYSREPVADLT